MDAKKALEQLYAATRQLPVNADAHDQLKKLAEIIMKELSKEKEDASK